MDVLASAGPRIVRVGLSGCAPNLLAERPHPDLGGNVRTFDPSPSESPPWPVA